MKKTLSTIVLLLLFSVAAFATTVTVSSTTLNNYSYGGATAKLRIYLNAAGQSQLITSDNQIRMASNVAGNTWYKEIICTVAGTTITIPAFTIDSTTDSSVPTAGYTGVFFDSKNIRRDTFFSDYRMPTSFGGTVSWTQFITYNQGQARPPTPEVYTTDQVNSLITYHTHTSGQITDFQAQVSANADVAANTLARHSHANKSLLDSIASNGDGTQFLANDGVYKTITSATDTYALEFTPNQPWNAGFIGHNAYFGHFWTAGATPGACFWEGWVKAEYGAFYFISAGHGGSHPILLGFDGATSGRLRITGNIFNGSSNVSFNSVDSVAPGEWHHVAAGFDPATNFIYAYLDGVLTARQAFTGTRTVGGLQSDLGLYIGGSDHSNFAGEVLRVRGYENQVPFASGTFPGAFQPQPVFTSTIVVGTSEVASQFLTDFSKPANSLADLSSGYNSKQHSGARAIGTYGEQKTSEAKLPQWVKTTFAAPAASCTPASIPGSAILYDDFCRQNQTFAWKGGETANYPYVGTSRTGQAWQGTSGSVPGQPDIGILEGAAAPVASDINNGAITYASTGTTNYTITVNQRGAAGATVILRRIDDNNQIRMSCSQTSCVYVRTASGSTTFLGGGVISNSNWTQMIVTVSGTSISTSVGGSVFPLTETTLTTGQLVGFQLAGTQRIEDITVMP